MSGPGLALSHSKRSNPTSLPPPSPQPIKNFRKNVIKPLCNPPPKPLSLSHKKPLQMTEPHFAIPKNCKTPPKNAHLYRYGFNGKEKTDEMFGEGDAYDYAFRNYDPRTVRFFSIDPLTNKYPHYSPYQFAGNNPIKNIDIEGAEELPDDIVNWALQKGEAYIKSVVEEYLREKAEQIVANTEEKAVENVKEHTTPAQQQAIGLTGEFILGVGPKNRYFGPNEPITQDIARSKLTEEARQSFYEQNKDALSKGDYKNVKSFKKAFSFGIKGIVTEGRNAQQFVGSATYEITFDEKTKSLNFTISNETSKNSLMYHRLIPGVDATSHSREEDKMLGTTSQTFQFSESIKAGSIPASGSEAGGNHKKSK